MGVAEPILSSQNVFLEKPPPGRIELVIHGLSGGGSERQMACLANHLIQQHSVRLVTLSSEEDDRYALDERVERKGLGLVSSTGGLFRGPLGNWGRVRALQADAKDWKPELVVSFCDTTNILTLTALAGRYPVLISERSDPRKQRLSWLWEGLRRMQYPRATRCVVQTDDLKEYFQRTLFRRAPSKVITIPSAIQPPLFRVDDWLEDRTKRDRFTCLYMGRFSLEKRIDRLLRAWKEIAASFPNWTLKLVGDGPERTKLQEQASELTRTGSIHWEPWTTDAWREWQRADLFVLTSDYEGFPQSVLEGMTSGLPGVVLNCSKSIEQLYRNTEAGFMVESEGDLARALCLAMSSASERRRMGENAHQAAEPYLWKNVASQWERAIADTAYNRRPEAK